LVRNNEVEIEIDSVSEALAARTGAIGIVEGEQARLGLLIDGAVVLAFKSVVEDQTLGGISRCVGNELQNRFAIPFPIADLDGIDKT